MYSDWALIVAAVILAAGWVVGIIVDRQCRHEWENLDVPQQNTEIQRDWSGKEVSKYIYWRQMVRCKKCGKNTSQLI